MDIRYSPYHHSFYPIRPATYTYYDYLIVVDFEATCEDNRNNGETLRPIRNEKPEIIQFPAILVDVRQMAVVDQFDCIVKPVENPVLSEFCTSLTGISQDMVDKAFTFPQVLRKFEKWLKKHQLNNSGNGRTFALVTDGSYDMGHFLYKQSIISNMTYPHYALRWVNLRTIFSQFYCQRWYNLKSVLEIIGSSFEGRPHNGLDDARNIAKVLIQLLEDGCVIAHTEKIVLDFDQQQQNETRILNDKRSSKYDLATVQPAMGTECVFMVNPHMVYCRIPETDEHNTYYNGISENNKENSPPKSPKKSPSKSPSKGKKKAVKSEGSQSPPISSSKEFPELLDSATGGHEE